MSTIFSTKQAPFFQFIRFDYIFWQLAILSPLTATFFAAHPSLARQIGANTSVEFSPVNVGLTCSFSAPTAGFLGVDANDTVIGTNQGSGTPASYTVTTNFPGGELIATDLTFTRDTVSALTEIDPLSSGTLLANVTLGQPAVLNNNVVDLGEGSNSITAGVTFQRPSSAKFDAGEYDSSYTLTCTDDGSL